MRGVDKCPATLSTSPASTGRGKELQDSPLDVAEHRPGQCLPGEISSARSTLPICTSAIHLCELLVDRSAGFESRADSASNGVNVGSPSKSLRVRGPRLPRCGARAVLSKVVWRPGQDGNKGSNGRHDDRVFRRNRPLAWVSGIDGYGSRRNNPGEGPGQWSVFYGLQMASPRNDPLGECELGA
jgi:hypothetical protein